MRESKSAIDSFNKRQSRERKRDKTSYRQTYFVWRDVKKRCLPDDKDSKRYFYRGITVCSRWESFDNFLSDMGLRPIGLSIERIDNDSGYSPDNCRWATAAEQKRNTVRTKFIEFEDQRMCVTDFAIKYNINRAALGRRLLSGWTVEKALTTPVRKMVKK
jgi:hypothetical protein